VLTAAPVIREVLRIELPSQRTWMICAWRSKLNLFIVLPFILTDYIITYAQAYVNTIIIKLSIFDNIDIDIFIWIYYNFIVDVIFATEELDRLEVDGAFTAGLHQGLVKAYRSRINIIRQAVDERLFYAIKSLHFEKLAGKRKHQYSMRLNSQYRLIVELVKNKPNNTVVKIVEITDYH